MPKLSRLVSNIVYGGDHELIFHPAKKNVDKFIVQAILATAFAGMSGGAILTGYFLWMGAPKELISYLPILGNVCGVFLVICAPWVNRREHRRRLMICVALASKTFLFGIVFVPFVCPPSVSAYVSFFMLILGNMLSAVCNMIFNTWFVEIVPQNIRGRCFSARQIFCVVTTMIVPVAAGSVLDSVAGQYVGFFSVFMAAIVTGALELYVFSRIDDVTIKTDRKKTGILTVIKVPLANKKFMGYTVLMFFHHLIMFIGASFNQIFMIDCLDLSYTYISTVPIISSALQILLLYKFWGRVSDRISSQFAMTLSMFILVIEVTLWSVLKTDTAAIIFPFLYVFSAIGNSGFSVGSFNRRYDVIPAESRVIYDSFFSCALGISLLVSPMLGIFVRGHFERLGFSETMQNGHIRMAYLVTAGLLLLLGIINVIIIRKTDRSNKLFQKESYAEMGRIFKTGFIRTR